jgi:hypothetical protein
VQKRHAQTVPAGSAALVESEHRAPATLVQLLRALSLINTIYRLRHDWERAMCKFRWAQAVMGLVTLSASILPVKANPATRSSNSDATYLEEAFSHDLCTRNDRDLRKLNKALSKKPAAGSR